MKALTYLTLTRLKNSLKSFFKSPGRVILVLVFVGLFVMLLFTGGNATVGSADVRDIRELYGIVLGFYFLMFVILARAGLSNGASFFTMADVNNIFVAPFPQRSVLLYGLVRQLGTTFMMAFFLIYQYGWLNNLYGIGLRGLFGIVIGYMLTVYCSQLVAMGIYSYTSCDDKRRAAVSRILYALSFVEAGNAWHEVGNFNPFELKRSAGVGVRIFLPMIGMMGIDWAYGFDKIRGSSQYSGSQFHFILGQEF